MQLMSQFSGVHHNLTAQATTPSTSIQAEVDQKRPRHTQPHTEIFTNEDNSLYPQFRSLLEAKLRIDARAIGSEEEGVWYGFGRLSGKAAGRIHPWMQYAQSTPEFTIKGLLKQMDQAFADPQKQAKALIKINRIQQRNQDFRTYLQDFEQTLLEAQGWSWADEVKKGYLRAGLNRDLCDRLVSQPEPDSYNDFTAQLRMISDKLQQIRAWDNRRDRGRGSNLYTPQTTQSAGNSMDWEPTQTTTVAASGRPQSHQQRARWVDQDEIGRRMSEGTCLRCGKHGHIIKSCLLLPAQNPHRCTQVQRQSIEGGRPRVPVRKAQVATFTASKNKIATATGNEPHIKEPEEWETDNESEKE